MHPDWSAFPDADPTRTADPPAATPDPALIDLSATIGLIAVGGPDARTFLQGQVSNDVREVSPTHSQLSAHCSPKGRMLASFRVMQHGGDGLLLILPRVQVAGLLQRLGLFRLRSQATLTDASDELVSLGVIGAATQPVLAAHFGALPALEGGVVRADDAALLRIPGEPWRAQVIAPPTTARVLWSALAAVATPAGPGHWALADIRAGLPVVLPETAEAFVPQMANLHLIDGVSFHKGCYAGQEVVARMQYLGKLKRRMYYARVTSDRVPGPGEALFAPGSASEQGPGQVVNAIAAAPGEVELLAVVEIASAEGGEVRLAGAADAGADAGPLLHLTAPPYGLPTEV